MPALTALVESAYRGERSREGWTTEADLLDGQRVDPAMLAETLERPATAVVVAERHGELLACCELEWGGGDGYFGMFAVRPTQQGTGLGGRMLDHAERLAAARGCRRMRMKVLRQRTDLIAWYERRGYRPTGETFPFPYGDKRFGIPKRPDLEFVELVVPLPPAEDGAH
nr:GNAT family N-acetyltransferase [Allosalinactinospora lopnorensis]